MAPSAVRVDPVDGRKDREAFRLLPHRLYAEDPFWVAPPNKDIARFLHPKRKHAFYGSGDIQWMLARRDGRVVGRIAAIENRTHNAHHSLSPPLLARPAPGEPVSLHVGSRSLRCAASALIDGRSQSGSPSCNSFVAANHAVHL